MQVYYYGLFKIDQGEEDMFYHQSIYKLIDAVMLRTYPHSLTPVQLPVH
jgi:hypothetical protein